MSLSRWGIRTVHLNPMTRVEAVHGPSLRSALSIVACVLVPTRSMHAHPQNCTRACMHGLDVALLRHPYAVSYRMPIITTDASSHQSMHPATMQQPDEDNQKANAAWRAVHGVLLFEDVILAWGIDAVQTACCPLQDGQMKASIIVTSPSSQALARCAN